MTEVETLIAVAGTLAGTLLGTTVAHFLDERRETRRISREVALKPLEDKQAALKDLYYSEVSLLVLLGGVDETKPDKEKVDQSMKQIEASCLRALLWFSPKARESAVQGINAIIDLGSRLSSSAAWSIDEDQRIWSAIRSLNKQIEDELGLQMLASQIEQLARGLRKRPS